MKLNKNGNEILFVFDTQQKLTVFHFQRSKPSVGGCVKNLFKLYLVLLEKFYAKINQTKMIGIWYKAYQLVYYMYYDRKVWMVSALNQGPVWQSVLYLLLNSQASLDLVNNTIKKILFTGILWALMSVLKKSIGIQNNNSFINSHINQ